jgi:hypothetical protein
MFGKRIALSEIVSRINMFRISAIETRSQRTLVVEGKLIEPWIDQLGTAWRNAGKGLEGRKLVINLNNLTVLSSAGEEAILDLMTQGARFSCCGVLNRHVLKQLARKCHGKIRDATTKPNHAIETAKSPRR